jgi:hypothetical protein
MIRSGVFNPWQVLLRFTVCAFVGLLVSLFMIFRGEHIPGHTALGPVTILILNSIFVVPYAAKRRA